MRRSFWHASHFWMTLVSDWRVAMSSDSVSARAVEISRASRPASTRGFRKFVFMTFRCIRESPPASDSPRRARRVGEQPVRLVVTNEFGLYRVPFERAAENQPDAADQDCVHRVNGGFRLADRGATRAGAFKEVIRVT